LREKEVWDIEGNMGNEGSAARLSSSYAPARTQDPSQIGTIMTIMVSEDVLVPSERFMRQMRN